MSTAALWQRGNAQAMAELQWRASSILMTVVLGLLAIVLSQTGPRSGRYTGFFSAILVYIIYSNLLGVTRAWVAKEAIASSSFAPSVSEIEACVAGVVSFTT